MMRAGRSRVVGIATSAVVLLALTPAPALACPVCGLAGPGDNGWAYALMSAMLSALPLGMIGGIAFWVYRRAKAADAESREPASAASIPTDPLDAVHLPASDH